MTQGVTDRSALVRGTQLHIAETSCFLQSSHPELCATLKPWIKKRRVHERVCDFALRVQVVDSSDELEPTHFRGAGHLVIAQYGANVFLFDLLRRKVEARISRVVAKDTQLWADRLLPLMLGVLGPSIGLLVAQRLPGQGRERAFDRRGVHGG